MAEIQPQTDRWISDNEAADYLSVSTHMLRGLRRRGGGPEYAKIGKLVRYKISALEAWVESNARRHTSDPGCAR